MPPSDDAELDRLRQFGKIVAPYVVLHIATALATARYSGPSGMPSSEDWRTGVITDSVKDAIRMMKLVLG